MINSTKNEPETCKRIRTNLEHFDAKKQILAQRARLKLE